MGATGLAYDIARGFGLRLVDTRPGLVPLTFSDAQLDWMRPHAGIAVQARVGLAGAKISFAEGLLFTHRGLSGPSILQISNYWHEGQALRVDLAQGRDLRAELMAAKRTGGGKDVVNTLDLPDKLARSVAARAGVSGRLGDLGKPALSALHDAVHDWQIVPQGTEGYRTAEVTLGGVDTRDLDARTMQARAVPGLFFVGEAVDVTGWLGGYNFQWAWSSGWAAGQVA
jgi:hypothetical protein